MEALITIFWIAVLFGIAYLFVNFEIKARKAINRNILYRSQHKEGRQILEPIVFRTQASISDVNHALATHVTVAEPPQGYTAVMYQAVCRDDGVAYAFGGKNRRIFLAIISFVKDSVGTKCTFQITKWLETDGLIAQQDRMKKLRAQVQTAFASLNSSQHISEDSQLMFCPNCGTKNAILAKFCKQCGSRI